MNHHTSHHHHHHYHHHQSQLVMASRTVKPMLYSCFAFFGIVIIGEKRLLVDSFLTHFFLSRAYIYTHLQLYWWSTYFCSLLSSLLSSMLTKQTNQKQSKLVHLVMIHLSESKITLWYNCNCNINGVWGYRSSVCSSVCGVTENIGDPPQSSLLKYNVRYPEINWHPDKQTHTLFLYIYTHTVT